MEIDHTQPFLEPPRGFFSSLKYLGPGLILSAAVVGSGELIATTTLGAKAGFAVLWVILLGCFLKVAVQLQYGRQAIAHGQASFSAWNAGKGTRLFGLHWSVCFGFIYLLSMLVGQGGVLGGAAQAAQYWFPNARTEVVAVAIAVALALLVFRGTYRHIEVLAILFNVLFTSLVLYCVFAVQRTEFSFGWNDVAGGFSLQVPSGARALALTAFGITGLSAGEIVVYPSWCIEKGYAAWAGPRDGSPEWAARARGWMRVMTYDALVSLAVYTVATVSFYFLGAAVLHPQGDVVDGGNVIQQLSQIFIGLTGGETLFMVGAFLVLFSTAFSNLAGHSRLWVDFFGISRICDSSNVATRKRLLTILAWVMPVFWCLSYIAVQKPIALVIVLGIANSIFLLVVAYQALVFRYRNTDPALTPSRGFDVFLWLSVLAIGFMAARVAWLTYLGAT
ncbi:MAG: Nramp family divalent metal transporter [Planctomycetes bacterium]|nr:Nramp family divalent metal transporter [Planctomycetota bacterium]